MCESKISKKFATVMTADSDYNNNAVVIWSDQFYGRPFDNQELKRNRIQ